MQPAHTLPAFSLPVYEPRRVFIERIGSRKLIYLDQNVWIDLREVKTPQATACLDACRTAVSCGKALFPLAYPSIAETVEISDIPTRLRQADLLDSLSLGVTFRSSVVLLRLEGERAWRWLFAKEENLVVKEEVFSSPPDHLDEPAVMKFPAGWTAENVEKFMTDLRGKSGIRSVRFIAEQRDWGDEHVQRLERYVQDEEADRQRRLGQPKIQKQRAFALALREGRQHLIHRFVVPAAAKSVLAEYGPERALELLQQFRATMGDGDDGRMKKLFERMPVMDQHARIMACGVVDTNRRPQPQDFYDAEHGMAPPIFSDAFVTRDSRLARMVIAAGRGRAQVITDLGALAAWIAEECS